MTPLERVGVAPIVEKLVENRLRWFRHVERRPVDVVERRVDQTEERTKGIGIFLDMYLVFYKKK